MAATIIRIASPTAVQPILCFQVIALLESLPDGNEVLRRTKARHWIQIASHIKPYRSNGRRITQSQADGVGIVSGEVMQIDGAVDVAPIVKNHSSQRLDDSEWESHLRIEDEQLLAAHRHCDVHAPRLALQHVAERNQPLRPCLVNREA